MNLYIKKVVEDEVGRECVVDVAHLGVEASHGGIGDAHSQLRYVAVRGMMRVHLLTGIGGGS